MTLFCNPMEKDCEYNLDVALLLTWLLACKFDLVRNDIDKHFAPFYSETNFTLMFA